jgi:hypothetical protein
LDEEEDNKIIEEYNLFSYPKLLIFQYSKLIGNFDVSTSINNYFFNFVEFFFFLKLNRRGNDFKIKKNWNKINK